MDLPRNARVVIVDDEYDEVKGLMAALAKTGVAVAYFNGRKATFPEKRLVGVRLLFLDLMMTKGGGMQSTPNVVSAAVMNYTRLIADNNGPIIVVLWTKHANLSEEVEQKLKSVAANPLMVVCMEKSECKTAAGNFSTRMIMRLLHDRLSETGAFGLYVVWENAIYKGSVMLSDRFSRIAPEGLIWQDVMPHVFYELYVANNGDNKLTSIKTQFLSACEHYVEGLAHEIGLAISQSRVPVLKDFSLDRSNVILANRGALLARINSFLYYELDVVNERATGTVFTVGKETGELKMKKKAILHEFYKVSQFKELMRHCNARLCGLIITPSCDIAHRKELRPSGNKNSPYKYDRILWGVLVKSSARKMVKDKCPRDKMYALKGFEFERETYDLVFHVGMINVEMVVWKSVKRLFTLKSGPLADIQAALASQLNRIGICSVE